MQFDKRDLPSGDASDPVAWAAVDASAASAGAPALSSPSFAVFALRRTTACPCGSGRRHKHCCGALATKTPAEIVHDAVRLMNVGEAAQAEYALSALHVDDVHDATIALEVGAIHLDLNQLSASAQWLERALALDGGHARIRQTHAECRQLMTRRATWAAAAAEIAALLDRLQARARRSERSGPVHIVCKLDAIGGTERRALNLYRYLSARARVSLWSTASTLPAHAADIPIHRITADAVPSGGTLIVVGTYFECGDWLQTQPFDRVVICHNLSEQHASLRQRLRQIEANSSRPWVELTFPSALFREVSGLPGRVEYSPVDTGYFDGSHRAAIPGAPLRIGRHGRAYPWKFHPNDPAFFRNLTSRGHAVRILGGSVIADAFAGDVRRPELLDVGAVDAREFLAGLDVFVFRKHPHFFETGGTVILEAMAMQLPVIVFAEDCGYAEVITDGENGFIVGNEAEALACVERLQADADLRVRLGAAARATVIALMRAQESNLADAYLGQPGAHATAGPGFASVV
jgi:glycosyltransferase involved in cell wall biosynthesis